MDDIIMVVLGSVLCCFGGFMLGNSIAKYRASKSFDKHPRMPRAVCFHKLRVALGLTLRKASEITGASPAKLSRMECGLDEPDFALYEKLPFPEQKITTTAYRQREASEEKIPTAIELYNQDIIDSAPKSFASARLTAEELVTELLSIPDGNDHYGKWKEKAVALLAEHLGPGGND